MLYNIMKRQQNNLENRFEREIEVKGFLNQCVEVYMNISEALKEQDDFYKEYLSDGIKPKFQEIYEACPFIKCVCDGRLKGKRVKAERGRMKNVRNVLEDLLLPFIANFIITEKTRRGPLEPL